MALRGPGAKALSKRGQVAVREVLPWGEPGLTRAERVIAFCEDLPITAGKLAGTKMQLREWQRAFIRQVYAEDTTGRRPVRTAVLSMGRKNGKTQLDTSKTCLSASVEVAEATGRAHWPPYLA